MTDQNDDALIEELRGTVLKLRNDGSMSIADRQSLAHLITRAADRLKGIADERAEWQAAATARHANPADFRYWEGRYRDEKARADEAEALLQTERRTAEWTEERAKDYRPRALAAEEGLTAALDPAFRDVTWKDHLLALMQRPDGQVRISAGEWVDLHMSAAGLSRTEAEKVLMARIAEGLVPDEEMLFALESALTSPFGHLTHRHRKGGLYRMLARGYIEATLAPCVIYQDCQEGYVWVRPEDEFTDGRFTALVPEDILPQRRSLAARDKPE